MSDFAPECVTNMSLALPNHCKHKHKHSLSILGHSLFTAYKL